MADEITYSKAIEELGTILNELEASEIDVDLLAKKVERGNELIQFCSQRLEKVSTDVEAALEQTESDQS